MSAQKPFWRADPLQWGHGPMIVEVFLEPTCPFSVTVFNKLDDFLEHAGEERVTVKIRLHSQPWHLFSAIVTRCILAASMGEGGKAAAKTVMAAIAAHREAFEFTDHCAGPNMDATPNNIIDRLEDYSGIRLRDAFAVPELQEIVKWHCKYARQNGIHVSPSFMIDGLVDSRLRSRDDISTWLRYLSLPDKTVKIV